MTTLFILILGIFFIVFISTFDDEDQDYRQPEGDSTFKDITTLTEDQLTEWRDEDPKHFYANLARQAQSEIGEDQFYLRLADRDPAFGGLLESGALGKLMEENPQITNFADAYRFYMTEDPRLKDPKKHGGTASILAARLRERRGTREGRKRESELIPTQPNDY